MKSPLSFCKNQGMGSSPNRPVVLEENKLQVKYGFCKSNVMMLFIICRREKYFSISLSCPPSLEGPQCHFKYNSEQSGIADLSKINCHSYFDKYLQYVHSRHNCPYFDYIFWQNGMLCTRKSPVSQHMSNI